jgi:hypothetical protein
MGLTQTTHHALYPRRSQEDKGAPEVDERIRSRCQVRRLHNIEVTWLTSRSISQYERKLEAWRKEGDQGVRIKRTAKDSRKVNRCIEERVREGKESVVVIDGVVQSKEKTVQELARPQYRDYRGG